MTKYAESLGDHGPINSWDRQPFLTDISGADSFESVPTHVQENFIIANCTLTLSTLVDPSSQSICRSL